MASEAVDQKENLISALTKILLEAGYAQEKVDQTLTSFNTDVTIQEFTSYYNNAHVFKSMGFPNAKVFQAALQDIKQNRPKNRQTDWETDATATADTWASTSSHT